MNLLALPAFTDNYIWMLHDGRQALVVDPGDPTAVIDALNRLNLELTAILVTHHHQDHIAGIHALRSRLNGPVYGPENASIDCIDIHVSDGFYIDLQGHRLDVWQTPGHTADHICFVVRFDLEEPHRPPLLFCGDTLFSAGCGRVFDGTAQQLFHSLSRIASLPADTDVCCAHEYTLNNLLFAQAVEPHNQAIIDHQTRCQRLRSLSQPTLPTKLGTELNINPFLRCDQPQVIASAKQHGAIDDTPLSVFVSLRQWKNSF